MPGFAASAGRALTTIFCSSYAYFSHLITASGLQVLRARDNLTGSAKARFESQLVKRPRWAKPRKPHGKASAWSFTGAEAAEIAVDKAEQSSKVSHKQPGREDTPESSSADEIIIPRTPELAAESQGGTTKTLALRTPERLRAGPDLAPRAITTPRA
jgi:hypothetical protein